jgi:transposase
MIEADKRKAIYYLHKEGMGVREISRHMNISVNTVNTIIGQAGEVPQTTRSDKIEIDADLLSRIYHRSDSRVQRTHEILSEEHGINIGYSTLSRMIRELGLGQNHKNRCHRVPDKPGAEMQHDTSPISCQICRPAGSGSRQPCIFSLFENPLFEILPFI